MAVTVEDIAETLGRATPSTGSVEYMQWNKWIANAMLLLRIGDGEHQGFGDLSTLDQEALDYVVTEAVAAMARRPDDATQVEVAVDDGRIARTYSSSIGRVFIRDEWWDLLSQSDGAAFSIGPC